MPRKPLTEEHKRKLSEAQKKRYENPEEREKIGKAVKKRYENPEEREKHSESIKKAYENPELREKLSEAQKKRYENPEERKKISEAVKKRWQNSDYKKKTSEAIKKAWENFETRKKTSKAIKKAWENPELREKQSNAVKKAYENPELREKRSEVVKKRYENPEERKKTSKAVKKAWENPEMREKLSEGQKKRYENPEEREKTRKASKKAWENPEMRKKHSEAQKKRYENLEEREKIGKASKKVQEIKRSEFIEKYNLSKEFLEKEFVENNRFDIYRFCEYCDISYSFAMKLKQHFNVEITNVQRNCLTQQEIYDFISQYVQADFNNRIEISPQELDIYIPSKNIAIEFDGLLYHSSGYSSLSACNSLEEYPLYHLEKTQACNEKNIQLFHIFENEWRDKKEIWKSVLLNAIGKSERIYARKCEIREVSSKETKEFLNANHLQGACSSKVNIGLYSGNTLVSLMTFGKPRYNKQYEWELLRFCNVLNTSVIGGAGKLLSYFIKNYNPKSILSYANLRWSTGNLYERLGFELISQSSPNYFYFNNDLILHSRIEFQKHKLKDKLETFDPSLTESENMYNNGYRKIYDCGNLVYEMKLD